MLLILRGGVTRMPLLLALYACACYLGGVKLQIALLCKVLRHVVCLGCSTVVCSMVFC